MIKIALFGTGNVATHLFRALYHTEKTQIIQVYNHSSETLLPFQNKTATTTSLNHIKEADIYLLAIKDNKVEGLAEQLKEKTSLIAHTSGSLPLLSIAKRNGVFYPLQTFSKNKNIDFSEIPICIEASQKDDLALLRKMGEALSPKVSEISTAQRSTLHLAAVFACNFTNALYSIAEDLCRQNEIPFKLLYPLILETAQKIKTHSPKAVQTGPAARGDQKTINFQFNELNRSEWKEIYTLFTSLIQNNNESQL